MQTLTATTWTQSRVLNIEFREMTLDEFPYETPTAPRNFTGHNRRENNWL